MSKKILLIDDDEDEQWIFTEALKEISGSIKCLYAVTTAEGVELSKQSLPDYIFLDVNMPVLNGLNVLNSSKMTTGLKKFL
jgi:CheY-like chemotaxis protein